MCDPFRLDGRIAVVTGGAGRFGRQIVRGLAEAGALVIIASRDLAKLEEYAAELREEKLHVMAMPLDQSNEQSIQDLRDRLLQEYSHVDILVNNAVLRPMQGWSSPTDDFRRSMENNATGLFVITRTFGAAMAQRGSGSIINIGSIYGLVGPDLSMYQGLNMMVPPDYYFHKGGLLQLTRYAAAMLGPRGVRVNAVSPGGFYDGQDPRLVERYSARTFLGRMAGEDDLRGVVVFLASDASAYITGANIAVDGGYTAI